MDLSKLGTKTAWIASLLILGRLIGIVVFTTWITNTAIKTTDNTNPAITNESK